MPTIEHDEGTLSAPGFARVKVFDGRAEAKVRRWTMAQRAELKPRVGQILNRIGQAQLSGAVFDLADLFEACESEIHDVCKASTELPDEAEWAALPWAELPDLAQAVWEVNIATPDGRGLAGKAMSLVAPLLNAALRGQAAARLSPKPETSPSTETTQSEPRPPDSPSSRANGAATSSDSATP